MAPTAETVRRFIFFLATNALSRVRPSIIVNDGKYVAELSHIARPRRAASVSIHARVMK